MYWGKLPTDPCLPKEKPSIASLQWKKNQIRFLCHQALYVMKINKSTLLCFHHIIWQPIISKLRSTYYIPCNIAANDSSEIEHQSGIYSKVQNPKRGPSSNSHCRGTSLPSTLGGGVIFSFIIDFVRNWTQNSRHLLCHLYHFACGALNATATTVYIVQVLSLVCSRSWIRIWPCPNAWQSLGSLPQDFEWKLKKLIDLE